MPLVTQCSVTQCSHTVTRIRSLSAVNATQHHSRSDPTHRTQSVPKDDVRDQFDHEDCNQSQHDEESQKRQIRESSDEHQRRSTIERSGYYELQRVKESLRKLAKHLKH
eukprot:4925289-Amphidinium_carterae.3